MPLFGRDSSDTTATWEPQAADGRLAQTAGATPGGVFTSDLSVSEYVLLGEAGFEPLGFVVGSSIYHIGLQQSKWGQNQELGVLTQAMYNARELAMSRMQAEAEHLGADGIVGVQLRMQAYVWGQDVLEFLATGTAVKALAGNGAHRAPDGHAFTSDLSAQDFYRLLAAGAVPVSFVLGTCVYHIAHQGRDAVAAPDGPEHRDGRLHPGDLRGPRARALADAGRGHPGAGFGGRRRHGRGLQPRLGRARHGVPRHGNLGPRSPTSTSCRTPRRRRPSRSGSTPDAALGSRPRGWRR